MPSRLAGGRLWPAASASVLAVVVSVWSLAGAGSVRRGELEEPASQPGIATASPLRDPPSTGTPPGAVQSQAATSAETPSAGTTSASGARVAVKPWPTRPATPAPIPRGAGTPQELRIASVDLSMRIVPRGVDSDGQMALPQRTTSVAWYKYGPPPGAAAGSAVLAGHVDTGEDGIGPLDRLRKVKKGDKVVVRSSSGSTTYVVESVKRVDKQSRSLAAAFDRTGPPRLRIITCGGAYRASSGGYQDNVVVTAVPAR